MKKFLVKIHLALLSLATLWAFHFSAAGQTLVEEAYIQKIVDTFDGRENVLSSDLPTLATNFSFVAEFQQFAGTLQPESASRIYVGAMGTNSYVLVTDLEGHPYCLMKPGMLLFMKEESQDAFHACFTGNHRFYFGTNPDLSLEFNVAFDPKGDLERSVVKLNFSALSLMAVKNATETKFTKVNETMTYTMPNERSLSLAFEPGPFVNGLSPGNPTNIKEVRMISPRASMIINQFQFKKLSLKKLLELNRKALLDAKIPIKEINPEELQALNLTLLFPKKYLWTEKGKETALKLKTSVGEKDESEIK